MGIWSLKNFLPAEGISIAELLCDIPFKIFRTSAAVGRKTKELSNFTPYANSKSAPVIPMAIAGTSACGMSDEPLPPVPFSGGAVGKTKATGGSLSDGATVGGGV